MKLILLGFVAVLATSLSSFAQCTPQGDQTTYGTNDRWIGYVYKNKNFTGYVGYVNEGTSGNPFFDQSFGGDNVNYNTNGCPITTENFSIRYKLRRAVPNGTYRITVGGDDGYRFSVDGGATWIIDKWNDHTYITTTVDITLSGTVDVVLEYYEGTGPNRITLAFGAVCIPMENQATYGTNNIWKGYVYDGTSFNTYKGMVNEGTASNPNFDQSFGGDMVTYNTSACGITTDNFSVRYRLAKTFTAGTYSFIVGGDAGYRLSLNGGTSWAINNWTAHTYQTSTLNIPLSGAVNMVLEYYDNSGGNRVMFSMIQNVALPVSLLSFTGTHQGTGVDLNWEVTSESNPDHFDIERSTDGIAFKAVGSLEATTSTTYSFADAADGSSWYRLKMTDRTGVVTYSKLVSLRDSNDSSRKVTVYPTVVNGTSIFLQTSASLNQASLLITDANGRRVNSRSLGKVGRGQVSSVDISNSKLPAGMYFVQVLDGSENIATRRIIVR